MSNNFQNEVGLFMIFDILGDTQRTGPLLWQIDRQRLEDIKDHAFDLIIIYQILEKYFPVHLDYRKVIQYCICHDLPEAITGDITKFEGVSSGEIKRVTDEAIRFLIHNYGEVMDFEHILPAFENKDDLEAKVVGLIDKLHSSTTFIKYECENHVNMDDPKILPMLRKHPFVVAKIEEGKDLADIFYEFHMLAINFSDEELKRYSISRNDADVICETIKAFGKMMHSKKNDKTLFAGKNDFPKEAMLYNRNK